MNTKVKPSSAAIAETGAHTAKRAGETVASVRHLSFSPKLTTSQEMVHSLLDCKLTAAESVMISAKCAIKAFDTILYGLGQGRLLSHLPSHRRH